MRTPDLSTPLLPDTPDERLEQWLDGSLPPDEAQRVAMAVSEYDAWGRAARAALRVQNALHATRAPQAPPDFAASVMRRVGEAAPARRAVPSLWERVVGWLRVPAWQPALALATVVLVALVVWPRSPQPTAAEVAASVEDVKWTLAFLSQTSENAGLRVRDDVLAPHVVGPVHRALEASLLETPR